MRVQSRPARRLRLGRVSTNASNATRKTFFVGPATRPPPLRGTTGCFETPSGYGDAFRGRRRDPRRDIRGGIEIWTEDIDMWIAISKGGVGATWSTVLSRMDP